jgi:hypothetical protein
MQEVTKKLFGAMIEDINFSKTLNESNHKQIKLTRVQMSLLQSQTQNEFS